MRIALVLALASVLTACSGGEASSPREDDPRAETRAAPDLRTQAEALAAEVIAARIAACEAAARLYEPPGPIADVPAFIAARSDVLAGLDPSLIAGGDGTHVRGFDDSGFHEEFRDGSNQVRHLAAAIQAGATLGPAAALLHRVLRPDTPQDEALNDAGTRLGAALVAGDPSPLTEAGDWIRTNVCE